MPLKSLVVVVLRLYAIYFLFQGVLSLIAFIPILIAYNRQLESNTVGSSWSAVVFVAYLFFGVILWMLATKLSALVTKGHDVQLTFTSLTEENLYHFAFVFLGLFFVLSSLSGIVLAAHRFLAYGLSLSDNDQQRDQFIWPLLGHVATLTGGLASMLGARKWTNKLLGRIEMSTPPPTV